MDMRDVVGVTITAAIFFGIKALIEYIDGSPARKDAKAGYDALLAEMTPEQREAENAKKSSTDAIEALGSKIGFMVVADIAATTGKTIRGTRTTLIRRGITVADYDGAAKKTEIDARVAKS